MDQKNFRKLAWALALSAMMAGAACGPKKSESVVGAEEVAVTQDVVGELTKGTDREGDMAAIHRMFPAEYARIAAAVQAAGAGRRERLAAFDEAYGAFLADKGSSATLASDERLTEWVRTRLEVARALQAQDVTLCGYYFTMGRWGETAGSPEVLKADLAAGAAFADAIADGEAHPVQRSATSQTDARALGMAFGPSGATPETMDIVKSVARQGNDSLKGLPSEKQCAFGIAYYAALLELQPEIRGRIVSRMTMTGRYFSS